MLATRGGSQAKLDLVPANVKSFRVMICVVRLATARLLLNDTAVLDARPTWRFRLEWQHRNHTSFANFGFRASIAQFGPMQPCKTLEAWRSRQICVACRLLVCRLHDKEVGCEHIAPMAAQPAHVLQPRWKRASATTQAMLLS